MTKIAFDQKTKINRKFKDFNGINKQSKLQKMSNAYTMILTIFLVVQTYSRTPLNRLTQFPYDGTILRTSYGDEFQVDFSGVPPEADIMIKFEIRTPNVLTTTFVAVSSNETKFKTQKLAPSSLYGVNYTALQLSLDIAMLQLGKTQYINRKKQDSVDDILYFTVYNFDPEYRCTDIDYTISINIDTTPGVTLDCYPCLNGGKRKYPSQSCVCERCTAGYYGPDCSINMLSLTSGQPSTTVVNGPGMAFFLLDQTNELNILVKQTVGTGQVYFQFVDFEGEFASNTNIAQGRTAEGRFNVTAGTGGTAFTAVSSGSKMSLTVGVYGNTSTSIQASYSTTQKSNVLLIVLAVLGSVLFVGLAIAAIYIIRNSSWFQNGRESRQIRPVTQNLNDEQIERFFPTVILKNISLSHSAESSNIHLNESPQKRNIEIQDCVICLCPIEPQQSIKVTYCKHIFHAQCLIGWFKKQQNCPYCREQFTRTNSIKLYKKVKESHQGGVIKGEELVSAILSQQKPMIPSKDSIEMLPEKQPQKIKVGSRTEVQIQNLS